MKPELKIDHYTIKLFWGDLVWFHIQRSEFVGYHSWSDKNGHYSIEFITKTNSFVIEQDSRDKWVKILKELNLKL